MNENSIEKLGTIRCLCKDLSDNPKNIKNIEELKNILYQSSSNFVKIVEPAVLSTFYPILKNLSNNDERYKIKEKQAIVELLNILFDKIFIEKDILFHNIFGFLTFEIYNPKDHVIIDNPEEYKLAIVECIITVSKSISSELIPKIYTKENAPKLCQTLYVLLEFTKNERFKRLQIRSIECIMALARVLNDDDFNDIEMRDIIADTFLFFLPGLACQLKNMALSEEKLGHKIPQISLKAWGRLVTLLMQDYKGIRQINTDNNNEYYFDGKKWKNLNELQEYLDKMKRSSQWFKDSDKKLQGVVVELAKLTSHSHSNVRMELINTAALVFENCSFTIPISTSFLIEIIITLSADEDNLISEKSKTVLKNITHKLGDDKFKQLLENLEESFLNCINSLPRKFNGIDRSEQLSSLNLLCGYITLFGHYGLEKILCLPTHLSRLVLSLIHISEITNNKISLLEEYNIKDLEINNDNLKTPWKNFHHFTDISIQNKLESLCSLITKYGGAAEIINDYLLDIFINDLGHRKEATFLINSSISSLNYNDNLQIIKNIVHTYIDKSIWNIPLTVMIDDMGYEHTLGDVKNNIIQVCLLCEGIGNIATVLGVNYSEEFLLKTLYLILERAGSGQALVRAAGLNALVKITVACKYATITELINNNIDYFSFYIERKINRYENNENVLNVFSVILNYSTIEVLQSTSEIIKELLIQSCDKNKEINSTAYLRIFKIFIVCLYKWQNIKVEIPSIKPKNEKYNEHFKVTNLNEEITDFSDKIMDKTPEELYKEDMNKNYNELEDEMDTDIEEYKKPEPPLEIKLTVQILKRSLHFLPSKDNNRKLLVLEILCNGLEIIKNWEDELLPIVHQIWSPLTGRFQEFDQPLIINYSFQLLIILARLSKEFIRMRTKKDVLPHILRIIDELSKDSYLKDKGSAYRYTQAYKLQLTILKGLSRILIDLDIDDDNYDNTLNIIGKYLSNKQPIPLQCEALTFFKDLKLYNMNRIKEKLNIWLSKCDSEFIENFNKI